MTLDAVEFLRRFLQHVLPKGFVRIRYYGFLANCHRRKQLALARELLAVPVAEPANEPAGTDSHATTPLSALPPRTHAVGRDVRTAAARSLSLPLTPRDAMNAKAQRPAQHSLDGGALALRPAPAFLRFRASLPRLWRTIHPHPSTPKPGARAPATPLGSVASTAQKHSNPYPSPAPRLGSTRCIKNARHAVSEPPPEKSWSAGRFRYNSLHYHQ